MTTKKMKSGWVKPATILFTSEMPANEKAFAFALAQACEFHGKLILFHAYDPPPAASEMFYYDHEAKARGEAHGLEPLAERARQAGIECEVVVRLGLPTDEILTFTREREIDRIVMGTHSRGHVGKLMAGSVAEEVLRHSTVPVYVVGPEVGIPESGDFSTRSVLCAVSLHEPSEMVVRFAAELAAQHKARLVLQHVIRPQGRTVVMVGGTLHTMEADLLRLVPMELQKRVEIETIVVTGDPTEELVDQSRIQQADLIVLGAHGASAFAAIAPYGIVYKTLAHAHCPVITLSPVVLAQCGATEAKPLVEAYIPSV